jgi:hypothetical protein
VPGLRHMRHSIANDQVVVYAAAQTSRRGLSIWVQTPLQ